MMINGNFNGYIRQIPFQDTLGDPWTNFCFCPMAQYALFLAQSLVQNGSNYRFAAIQLLTKVHSGTGGFPCFAFWSVQPKPLKLGSMLIPHFKALICGYLLVKRSKG